MKKYLVFIVGQQYPLSAMLWEDDIADYLTSGEGCFTHTSVGHPIFINFSNVTHIEEDIDGEVDLG